MHMLHWLAENGTAAIVEFPGVLYRGAAEGKIRRHLVENNFVHAVIQLPPDLVLWHDDRDVHHRAEEGAPRPQRPLRGRVQ